VRWHEDLHSIFFPQSQEDSLSNGDAHQKKSSNVLFSRKSVQHLAVEITMFVSDILDRFYVLKRQES
jgi:hypothetical protein